MRPVAHQRCQCTVLAMSGEITASVVAPAYTLNFLLKAFSGHDRVNIVHSAVEGKNDSDATTGVTPMLQWDDYDALDWDRVLAGKLVANAYLLRKGLIRKAQLAWYCRKHCSKNPSSILVKAMPDTIILELDSRSLFSPNLYDAEEVLEEGKPWIVKPSVVDKATAVLIVTSYKQLKKHFKAHRDILEWVLQEYLEKPLLIDNTKFHVRVYVVAVGSLKVFVNNEMLALFALHQYNDDVHERMSHITNTCIQEDHPDYDEEKSVRLLKELETNIGAENIGLIRSNIHKIVGETFAALSGESSVFMALPNCFELFGFDFLVDEAFNCYLLEANAGPDLKQTGDRLHPIIETLCEGTVSVALQSLFPKEGNTSDVAVDSMTLVYEAQGPTWGTSNLKLT